MYRQVPGDLARRDFRGMTLVGEQIGAFEVALERLTGDQRFEWLPPKEIDEVLWHLACQAKAKPAESGLAEAFIDEYANEPISQTCFFSIEGLEVEAEVELFGIRFLPSTAITMPETVAAFHSGQARPNHPPFMPSSSPFRHSSSTAALRTIRQRQPV
jgi:hypothetical protein